MTYINNFPINFNIPQLPFRAQQPSTFAPVSEPILDGFNTNPLNDKFGTKIQIESSAKSNPRIQEILHEYNLPLRVNDKELNNLKNGHLKSTRIAAAQIYSYLPKELKEQVNLKDIQEAAMFHDYGKILIPDHILNKKGELSATDREIIQQHSELGYELLKSKGLSQNSLNLIKYHHQNPAGDGYPINTDNFEYGLESQILDAADKYCALREERSYKAPMSQKEALEIIKQDNTISSDIYNALEKAVT